MTPPKERTRRPTVANAQAAADRIEALTADLCPRCNNTGDRDEACITVFCECEHGRSLRALTDRIEALTAELNTTRMSGQLNVRDLTAEVAHYRRAEDEAIVACNEATARAEQAERMNDKYEQLLRDLGFSGQRLLDTLDSLAALDEKEATG